MAAHGATLLRLASEGALFAGAWDVRGRHGCKHPLAAKRGMGVTFAAAQQAPRLVTVLGKGGAGKTTAAVLLAKYYASIGRKTCLVLHPTEDRMADSLLGQELSLSGTELDGGALTAFRLESTKLFSEPLSMLKKADSRTGFSQGALEEVAAEELSVLPGVDGLLAAAVLERLAKTSGGVLDSIVEVPGMAAKDFEVVLYDGPSSGEALRIFGSPKRTRWYLRRFRGLADKTDAGRVALPSVARLLEAAITTGGGDRPERSTDQIWQAADDILSKAEEAFSNPKRFTAFLVAQSNRQSTVKSALRLWGGAMQAGVYVGGALLVEGPVAAEMEAFSPLKVAKLPELAEGEAVEWPAAIESFKKAAGSILDAVEADSTLSAVKISQAEGTVALFLPGFDKREVKLSQWRGGSELVVEVGDQRKSIAIPPGMQGKVAGAKFQDKVLTVTLKKS